MVAGKQANFRLDDETRARLAQGAAARYGGNRSDALRAAVELWAIVLASDAVATVDPRNGAAMLDAYRRGAVVDAKGG